MRAVIEKPECQTIEYFTAANKLLLEIASFPGPFDASKISDYWDIIPNANPNDHTTRIRIKDNL